MKHLIKIVLLISLILPAAAYPAERIVQLNLSGCADCNAASRIEKILKKIKGVKKQENKGHGQLIITFDDESTTLSIIINELKRGKLFVEGDAVFLK